MDPQRPLRLSDFPDLEYTGARSSISLVTEAKPLPNDEINARKSRGQGRIEQAKRGRSGECGR